MTANYRLYGAEFSLYSGKARSYLRKKGIPFEEIISSIKVYKRFIVPRTGVKYIPVVQTPDDEVFQDTTVIIDELEKRHPQPSVYPDTPVQRLVATLLELYGDEWVLIPAMHFRWFYREENYRFIIGEFGKMLVPGWPGFIQRIVGKKVGSFFDGAVEKLGVSDSNRHAIEASYKMLLADLQTHFSEHDYLLGSSPCIADFGLIAPMYAHLYRDPYPGKLMRSTAPAVAAWVERMVSDEVADGEFLPNDEIPDTLYPVLERMAAEQIPVLMDTDKQMTQWRQDNPDTEIPRFIGEHEFNVEGAKGKRYILPYSLWMFQRSLDAYNILDDAARAKADELLEDTGFGPVLQRPIANPMLRQQNKLTFK